MLLSVATTLPLPDADTSPVSAVIPPEDGVAQPAAVPDVAVNTCPDVGAVAPLTTMVVVALLRAFAAVAVVAVDALPVVD
jgi:hypothetical protein